MAKKDVPVGAKVISVLYIVVAILVLIGGIMLLVGAGNAASFESLNPIAGLFTTELVALIGTIIIILALVMLFTGISLWKGKNWARIVVIIISVISIIGAIMGMLKGVKVSSEIIRLVINLVIGGYLAFNKSVKKAFS